MLSYFRRSTQVAALTFVLVFGAFLMVGGFETLSWSDEHCTHTYEEREHRDFYGLYYEYSYIENHYFEEPCCP